VVPAWWIPVDQVHRVAFSDERRQVIDDGFLAIAGVRQDMTQHRHGGEQWQENKRDAPAGRFVRGSDGPDPGRARRMPSIRGPSVFRYPVVDHGPP